MSVLLCVLYGTQTGTAEKFSKQLAAKLSDLYGEATRFLAMDTEHYKHEDLLGKEPLTFFLLATYGDGEPTDNAMAFYEWLTKTSEDVMNGDQPELLKVRLSSTPCPLSMLCR
jgi:NADPH-ferrihemoprotein reductase